MVSSTIKGDWSLDNVRRRLRDAGRGTPPRPRYRHAACMLSAGSGARMAVWGGYLLLADAPLNAPAAPAWRPARPASFSPSAI